MCALHVQNPDGVKIYNLSAGKKLPEFLSERQRRQLNKREEYRKRIELIQDFEFNTTSQRVKVSRDGQYIMASGVYPPELKCFDVSQLSLKWVRRSDSSIVQFQMLSDDYTKLVLLGSDRTLEFHAAYGLHYKTRIPKFGRDMTYDRQSCDLFVGGSTSELYRLNLEQGRYLAPLQTSSPGVNALGTSPAYPLLVAAGTDGVLHTFDLRSRSLACSLNVAASAPRTSASTDPLSAYGLVDPDAAADCELTAVRFRSDGMRIAVGTSTGHCLLYDVRSSKPLHVKTHQYAMPIVDVKFHESTRNVMSLDRKVLKVWGEDTGESFCNVEPTADAVDLCVVPDSGLVMMAGEQARVMAYYIPELGRAPQWCSFLDTITEELEEDTVEVYDDYKFVTREELAALGLAHLVGTPLLRVRGLVLAFAGSVAYHTTNNSTSCPIRRSWIRFQ